MFGRTRVVCEIPEEYICPISLEIMSDPVILPSGYSFDKVSLEVTLSNMCPITRIPFDRTNLIPNRQLKDGIERFIKEREQGYLLEHTERLQQEHYEYERLQKEHKYKQLKIKYEQLKNKYEHQQFEHTKQRSIELYEYEQQKHLLGNVQFEQLKLEFEHQQKQINDKQNHNNIYSYAIMISLIGACILLDILLQYLIIFILVFIFVLHLVFIFYIFNVLFFKLKNRILNYIQIFKQYKQVLQRRIIPLLFINGYIMVYVMFIFLLLFIFCFLP